VASFHPLFNGIYSESFISLAHLVPLAASLRKDLLRSAEIFLVSNKNKFVSHTLSFLKLYHLKDGLWIIFDKAISIHSIYRQVLHKLAACGLFSSTYPSHCG
jgi:hypothetical protein